MNPILKPNIEPNIEPNIKPNIETNIKPNIQPNMQLYIRPNIVHSNEHNIPEVYIVQLFVSGGGDKTCTFGVFWGRKPVPKRFSQLLGEN